jgi:serine/threonine-protein kinase PRP4
MATDAHDSRRKHHRSSSPEDVERSSKRHKHRHHSHRHRHGSKKRDGHTEYDGEIVATVPAPNSHLPDDDVEEGEILEDQALDGEVGKNQIESDAERGEIEVTGDRDVRFDKKNPVCYYPIRLFVFVGRIVTRDVCLVAEKAETVGLDSREVFASVIVFSGWRIF